MEGSCSADARVGHRLRGWYGRWRPEVLLALVVLLLTGPIVQVRHDQQESRLALTAAIWDDGTVRLDRYEAQLGVDRATRGGHLYSDKPPGQPVLAIPAYALYRWVGGEPAIRAGEDENYALWASSLFTSTLPAIALVVLMRRFALRVVPERATTAALAMATGTMLLPFGTQLFSHMLTAALILGAYLLVVSSEDRQPWRSGVAGLLAGFAATAEYPAALLAVVLLLVAIARHRTGAVWFAVGTLPPAIFLAGYHWVAFDGPLRVSYRYSHFREHESGLLGVEAPDPLLLADALLGERGLFLLTPLVLLAVIGAVVLVRERRQNRAGHENPTTAPSSRFHGTVALAMLGVLLLVQAGWSNATGGASPGPRYLLPALPFLVVGAARIWQWWPGFTAAISVFSVSTMAVATFTLPLVPAHDPSALKTWISLLIDGRTATTVLTTHSGDWALALPLVGALAVAVRLLSSARGSSDAHEAAAP